MKKLPTMVILAGGYGTRLQKLTENIPKSMVKINGIMRSICIICFTINLLS